MRRTRLLLLPLMVLLLGLQLACGPGLIRSEDLYADDQGFRIDEEAEISDTLEHRQVLDVLVQYRRALMRKDIGSLRRLIAEDYYENAGTTATTSDDYGASELPEVFELLSQHAEEIRYAVNVKSVEVEGDQAVVDYEYEYAYRYRVGDQETWDAGVDVNRLELMTRDGEWKIVSGL